MGEEEVPPRGAAVSRLPRPQLPRPVVRVLQALGLPAQEIAHYWSSEARSIRSSAGALGIGLVATLIAGAVLGTARGPLTEHPGLLVLIPAAIGMRGSIYGALAARLSTGILTGQFEPALVRRSFLGRQIEASTLLTVSTSVEAGALAWGVSRLFGWQTIPFLELVAVSLVAGLLSSLVLLGVTVSLARRSLARDWSMDDVGAPTITATGDLVTLPALLLGTFVLRVEPVAMAIGALGVVAAVVAAIRGARIGEPTIRRIVRESLVVLTASVALQVLAGGVIESRVDQWLTVPALLVLIPPFVANCGSLGGMLASRLASKLHVGLLEPRVFPGKVAGLDFSLTFLLALLAFTGVGGVGWVAAMLTGLDPPPLASLVATSLLGGVMATAVLSLVAYGAATATFRFGLDPDNHGIPIVTASMDLLGILCLVAAIGLTKVG